MSAQLTNSWDAFKYHWHIWNFSGFQPPKPTSPWRIPYICYTFALAVLCSCYFPLSLCINCVLADNLNDFFEGVYVAITEISLNLKLLNLYMVRNQLLQVQAIFKSLDKRIHSTEEHRILQQGINSARNGFLTFLKLAFCAYTTSELLVLFAKERTLMYPAWFPFDWRASRKNFLWAHGYMTMTLSLQLVQITAIDTYPQAYLRILSAHVQALAVRIQNIGISRNEQKTQLSEEEKENNYEHLINCIKDHKALIDLFTNIRKPISRTCLVQFICTGIGQCTIGVYVLYVGFNLSIILNVIVYFTTITMETFILCYYGDIFCQECEKLSVAIYNCNWTPQSEKFKRTLLTFLLRSQKFDVVIAGNLIPMQLPTFVQIMKTAYSIFTLLSNFR